MSAETPTNLLRSKATHLDPSLCGYYREILVQNRMSIPVVVIDHQGQRTVLNPQATFGSNGVVVTVRKTDGSRADRTGNEISIDTDVCTIPDWRMMQEAVFVHSANIVVCTMNFVESAMHPSCNRVYEDAKREALQHLIQHDQFLTMHVLANDPTGETTRLYVHMFGKDLVVPVTGFSGNEAALIFIFASRGTEVHRFTVPLEDVLNGDGHLDTSTGFIIHVSNDLAKLKASLKAFVDRERLTQEHVDTQIKELNAAHKEEITRLKLAHASELDTKTIDYMAVANKLKIVEQEVVRLKAQNQEWAGIHDARAVEAKSAETDAKVQSARYGLKSEEIKYDSLLLKTVGAIVIAGVTWFIKAQLDKRGA